MCKESCSNIANVIYFMCHGALHASPATQLRMSEAEYRQEAPRLAALLAHTHVR